MGGCGIAIKKRGSPVVMLLMMEFGQSKNVTYAFHTQTYSDCSFTFLSRSIHQAFLLSLYHYIMIRVIIVRYDLTRVPLYDTICYKYDYPW